MAADCNLTMTTTFSGGLEYTNLVTYEPATDTDPATMIVSGYWHHSDHTSDDVLLSRPLLVQLFGEEAVRVMECKFLSSSS